MSGPSGRTSPLSPASPLHRRGKSPEPRSEQMGPGLTYVKSSGGDQGNETCGPASGQSFRWAASRVSKDGKPLVFSFEQSQVDTSARVPATACVRRLNYGIKMAGLAACLISTFYHAYKQDLPLALASGAASAAFGLGLAVDLCLPLQGRPRPTA